MTEDKALAMHEIVSFCCIMPRGTKSQTKQIHRDNGQFTSKIEQPKLNNQQKHHQHLQKLKI